MINKIRVHGKAQNRTALGIVHAYLVMKPNTTIDDIRKAFPNELCPDKGVAENFLPLEDASAINTQHNISLYFTNEDEILELNDGSKVAFNQIWTKASFERIAKHAEQFGIEIAEFEKTKVPGQKGGYRLEYLNGYVPQKTADKTIDTKVIGERPSNKRIYKALIAILGIALIILICLLGYKSCSKPEPVEPKEIVKEVVKEVVVRDTVYIESVAKLETRFNECQFDYDKAVLSEDAKFVLHDLATILKSNENLRLQIAGHTSSEGDPKHNQKLSEERAAAVVDFLVNREGIDPSRLESCGYGSSMPKDSTNIEVNRRTEFIIIE